LLTSNKDVTKFYLLNRNVKMKSSYHLLRVLTQNDKNTTTCCG